MKTKRNSLIFKIVLSFFLVIGISNCGRTKSDLKGMWVGSVIIRDDTISETTQIYPVVSVAQSQLQYRTIGYINGIFDRVDSFTTKYSLKKEVLSLQNNDKKIVIDYHNHDSITAYYDDNPRLKMIFNRIKSSSIKKLSELSKKEFEFRGIDNGRHSLYFANDSIAIEYHEKTRFFEIKKWELLRFEKQDFLLMHNDIMSTYLHADSTNQNIIYFSKYKGSKSFLFKEFVSTDSLNLNLVGSWKFEKRIDSAEYPEATISEIDKISEFNFTKEYLEYTYKNKKISKPYEVRGFGKLLLFKESRLSKSNVWKIDLQGEGKLILTEFLDSGQIINKSVFTKVF